LFPEPHNSAILRLLFVSAQWHGLAKLRLHSDQTLELLDNSTVQIGKEFRSMNNRTCPAFATWELRREVDARKRRQKNKTTNSRVSEADGPLPKSFNLQIYKYHSLGDYVKTIRRFGTTDWFSTESVSNRED
jgi:hypothetical protein